MLFSAIQNSVTQRFRRYNGFETSSLPKHGLNFYIVLASATQPKVLESALVLRVNAHATRWRPIVWNVTK